ncbi:MAG TPA: hypothetical protein VGM59_11690 [Dongiaceae bacterium]|jgi:hypothetical protein
MSVPGRRGVVWVGFVDLQSVHDEDVVELTAAYDRSLTDELLRQSG